MGLAYPSNVLSYFGSKTSCPFVVAAVDGDDDKDSERGPTHRDPLNALEMKVKSSSLYSRMQNYKCEMKDVHS